MHLTYRDSKPHKSPALPAIAGEDGAPLQITIPTGMTDELWTASIEMIEAWEATEGRMATDLAFDLFRLFRKDEPKT